MKLSEKIALVSCADHNYFELLNELIDSVLRFDLNKTLKICIVDGGLKKEQREILESKVYLVKSLKHNLVGFEKYEKYPYFAGLVSRIFLRETFSEFNKFIWIDSDAWLNSWNAIDYLVQASKNGKLAAVATADRHNKKVLTFKWLAGSLGFMKSQNFKHAKSSGYSMEICRKLALKPHINCGVFCLESNSNFWEIWRKEYEFSIKKGRFFGADQIAMNVCVYHKNCEVELLPHFCNWIPSSENTLWDDEKKKYVEKFYPHNEIGIMHLAGGIIVDGKDIRYNKNLKINIKTTLNETIQKSLRFSFD